MEEATASEMMERGERGRWQDVAGPGGANFLEDGGFS